MTPPDRQLLPAATGEVVAEDEVRHPLTMEIARRHVVYYLATMDEIEALPETGNFPVFGGFATFTAGIAISCVIVLTTLELDNPLKVAAFAGVTGATVLLTLVLGVVGYVEFRRNKARVRRFLKAIQSRPFTEPIPHSPKPQSE